MSDNIVVIGSNGQLGEALIRLLQTTGHSLIAAGRSDIDITRSESVETFFKNVKASVVINAAAYTAVDKAESEPEMAFAVNEGGAKNLADICRGLDVPLIHFSTDYVFDGKNKDAYRESDAPSPLGVYGKSKAAGEIMIRARLDRYIIIRTSWLYGIHGNNFVKTMLKLWKTRPTIRVVDDQFGCPTFAGDLAAAVLQIVDELRLKQPRAWGTYHYCNEGSTSWYEFAREIYQLAKQSDAYRMKCTNLVPIPTSEYPTAVRRPLHSVLNCQLIQKTFGIKIPHWKTALSATLPDLIDNI
jgi:dTDP-4-dehydrorhamnose reductase